MPSYTISIAAAAAVLDADLLVGERFKEVGFPRTLIGVALRGSAAAGDTEVDIMVDETRVSTLFNTSTGFPNADDVVDTSIAVPANAELSAIVRDAAATNPINLRLDLQ